MFAADLSWKDPSDIKVGERKERKSKKDQNGSSRPPSVQSSKSSTRDGTWCPSTKGSIASSVETIKPLRASSKSSSKASSKTAVDVDVIELAEPRRKASKSPPKSLNLSLKDPSLHPAWTYSGTLSPKLPSGDSFDLPGILPDRPRTSWSRKSNNSNSSRSSRENPLERKSVDQIIDEVHEIQQLSPKSFVSRTTRRSTEVCVAMERTTVSPVTLQENVKYDRSASTVEIQGRLDELQEFRFDEEIEDIKLREDSPLDTKIPESAFVPHTKETVYYPNNISPTLVSWKAPSEWEVTLSSASTLGENRLSSVTALSVDSTSDDLTHFQRFIRRMENAGPKIILDRMREEWHDVDEEADDELKLEKHLWVLTALQLQSLDKSVHSTQEKSGDLLRLPPTTLPIGHKRRVLELYGNIAEVYQLSAMQAKEKIYHLATKPQGSVTLPSNVSYLSVPQAGSVPFPYAPSSFNHIRASSLPSVVPSAKLPQVFRECHRLLAPGGVLEIRLMDSCPDRQTAGPKMRMWMEDRVSLNLEKSFRCSRPCMLVPTWVKEAGFSLRTKDSASNVQTLKIPIAFDSVGGTVDDELSTLVGRALWKDVWGDFVDEIPGEPKWFWEDESIMAECLARKTVVECCTLFAFKE